MRKILKYLSIFQEVSNKNRNPKLGRGFLKAVRLNPYNPLSYLTVFIVLLGGLFLYGVLGFWKEVDMKNPFKGFSYP